MNTLKQSPLPLALPDRFLSEYWQKKPLVVRQALPDFQSPLSGDELAGLALEEDVESRIILEHGGSEEAPKPWELRHGPFQETYFQKLAESHWTLLVQAVDHWVPEVHDLLKHFRFLPSWRLEDIMISYAADGGNVGPHFDHFDVFLLQAEGRRRWQIGPVYDDSAPRIKETPLHILSEFDVLEDVVLEPGDLLYLPPGVGHHGVAQGECITLSIGFRAPSHRDILMQFTDFVSDRISESQRYADADLQQPENPGEIDEKSLDRVQAILRQYTEDRQLLAQWFGEAMTQPKHPQPVEDPIDSWAALLQGFRNCPLYINKGSRQAFYQGEHFYLFADGEHQKCSERELIELGKTLCNNGFLLPEQWIGCETGESQQWLLDHINRGVLFPEECQ